MVRIFSFLILLTAMALGAAWVADQNGGVVLSWNGWRAETSLPVLALIILMLVLAAMMVWAIIRAFWKPPARLRRRRHEKRQAKARHAITQGLIAVGTGDSFAAHRHAGTAKRLAERDPLVLLLQAQTAQLEGDRPGAQHAFHAMAERKDMRLLGLRGLFIEAQRNDDPYTAVAMAEEALKIAPTSPWASHAVLGFRCAQGDWDGALALLDNNKAAGLIDTEPYRRRRGVLLTARALALEERDRDLSRKSSMEAIKFAPQLVPAAVLAAKFYSEDNQVRRAMRAIEVAWNANPHPDLAAAYAHVRLGDSARERHARVALLAQQMPEERERAGNQEEGRAREWTARAVRAAPDPAWTADGYVSDRWRPVSPVTGRLDAFQWVTPVAALASERAEIEAEAPALLEPMPLDSRLPEQRPAPLESTGETETAPAAEAVTAPMESPPAPVKPESVTPPPVFRTRPVGEARNPAPPPAIIPLVRAPDDPGVPEEDFPEGSEGGHDRQPGGWRGFVTRLGG